MERFMTTKDKTTLSVEELYIKEKKKSQTFMIISAVLTVMLIGLFLVHSGNNTTTAGVSNASPGNAVGAGRFGGGIIITDYFYTDGSLDKDAVNERLQTIPASSQSMFIERFSGRIQASADAGEISQNQANALIDYLYTAMSDSENI